MLENHIKNDAKGISVLQLLLPHQVSFAVATQKPWTAVPCHWEHCDQAVGAAGFYSHAVQKHPSWSSI